MFLLRMVNVYIFIGFGKETQFIHKAHGLVDEYGISGHKRTHFGVDPHDHFEHDQILLGNPRRVI